MPVFNFKMHNVTIPRSCFNVKGTESQDCLPSFFKILSHLAALLLCWSIFGNGHHFAKILREVIDRAYVSWQLVAFQGIIRANVFSETLTPQKKRNFVSNISTKSKDIFVNTSACQSGA